MCCYPYFQSYDSTIERYVVSGHEDDSAYEEVFWAKMLKSVCDPG